MTLDEFIRELRPMVRYDKIQDKHYMGSTILTNQEINHMLVRLLEEEYTSKTSRQRSIMRQQVFKGCM